MTSVPLRVRVAFASAAGAAVILAALSFFVYARLQGELVRAVDGGLRASAEAVASEIGRSGLRGLDLPDSGPGGVAQVLTGAGQPEISRGPQVLGLSPPAVRAIHERRFLTVPAARGRAPLRVFVMPNPEGRRLFVVTGSSLAGVSRTLASLRLLLETAGPAALALACLASWLLAGAALRPVERMRREAATISVSEPARRLPVPGANDEVARLGRTLNSLLDRLQAAIDREQRLLDDASHELRTPLSILKAELDLALSRAREPEELEAALRSASEETDRLAGLAEDLLVLSRARASGLRIHRMSTPLRDLLGRACDGHRARAQARGATIECIAPAVTVPVDPMRLRQALDNLLDNAIRYGRGPGGLIRVEAAVSAQAATIMVENEGAGFDADLLPSAFEEFIRGGDAASHPGAGLGLAIVRAVTRAHGGNAAAENVPGGARVAITLALDSAPSPAPAVIKDGRPAG
ncbi:MAG: HAMP domain-containing histidine kinase [Nocardiopsaceae bacterium]|jgi:signal transduction histidine kinase|nr:HAMP domain-containing histidine kinase [Nocardiopsaceae bacterium]